MLLGGALRVAPRVEVVAFASSLLSGVATLVILSRRAVDRGPAALAVLLPFALWRWTLLPSAAPALPELPCATLLALAAVSLDARDLSARRALGGAACLSVACGFRYEAWFASAGMLLALALRRPRRALLAAPTASLVPAAWLAINRARSGDALDFIHRVERFRRAEGLTPLADRLASFATELLPLAPWVIFAALSADAWRRHERSLAGALAVLAGVTLGELRGGGASHHAGRSLLFVGVLLAPIAAEGAARLVARGQRVVVVALATVALAAGLPRERDLIGVEPSAVRAGDAVRAAENRRDACRWTVISARGDFLWVMLRAGRLDRELRVSTFGSVEDPAARRRALDASCMAAVEDRWEDEARGAGMRRVSGDGGWSVYAR